MGFDIGTYVSKEGTNETGLVFAISRSIMLKNDSNVHAIKLGNDYTEDYYFDMEPSSGNDKHYQNLLNHLSFSNYKGPMKYEGSMFPKDRFLELYVPVNVVSPKKIVDVGGIYINSSNEKIFVLGVVKTDNDEDKHTIIVREINNDNYNTYIDFDHDQMGPTPDFVNCFFYNRIDFLKEYTNIK